MREDGCFAAPTKKAIIRAQRRSDLTIGEFRVDRPFLFIIADHGCVDGPVELMGRYLQPKLIEIIDIALLWRPEELPLEVQQPSLPVEEEDVAAPQQEVEEDGSRCRSPSLVSLTLAAEQFPSRNSVSSVEDDCVDHFLVRCHSNDEVRWRMVPVQVAPDCPNRLGDIGPIPEIITIIIASLLCVLAVAIFQELMGWTEFD